MHTECERRDTATLQAETGCRERTGELGRGGYGAHNILLNKDSHNHPFTAQPLLQSPMPNLGHSETTVKDARDFCSGSSRL